MTLNIHGPWRSVRHCMGLWGFSGFSLPFLGSVSSKDDTIYASETWLLKPFLALTVHSRVSPATLLPWVSVSSLINWQLRLNDLRPCFELWNVCVCVHSSPAPAFLEFLWPPDAVLVGEGTVFKPEGVICQQWKFSSNTIDTVQHTWTLNPNHLDLKGNHFCVPLPTLSDLDCLSSCSFLNIYWVHPQQTTVPGTVLSGFHAWRHSVLTIIPFSR